MDATQSNIFLSRQSKTLNFLDLNDDVFEEIFSYLSFDDIAKIRLVCSRFNNTSQSLLNKGATAFQVYSAKCQKEINAKLPRRNSEKRAHPLFKYLNVLTRAQTMLTHLLNTYNNQIAVVPGSAGNNTCFIAGKFLDEYYRVMKVVMTNQQSTLNYSLTKELSDIYYMAFDHFKEHILPAIKRNQQLALNNTSQRISFPTFSFPPSPSEFKLKDDRLNDNQKKEISELKSKVLAQEKLLNEHERKWLLLEQQLGLSLSQKTISLTAPFYPALASTSSTTLQPSKRFLQDDEEPRPTISAINQNKRKK